MDQSASGYFLTPMERIIRVIIAILLMLSGYAYAGCGNISDGNLRATCQAEMNGQSCGNISDSDQRAYCNAKSNGQSCGNIQDSNLRNECEAAKR